MSEIELEKHVSYVKDRQAWLASTFRDLMTTSQSFDTSNTYRKKFYDDVIRLADQNIPTSSGSIFGENNNFFEFLEGDHRVEEAGEMLCRFVDPRGLLDLAEGPRRPLIIFAFDDAHVLANNPTTDSWNIFSELRHILRKIYKLPIISLFISKAGKFNPSSPISEISFDDLAHSALEDTVTLDRVTHVDWMSHLGRPSYVKPSDPFRKQLTSYLDQVWVILGRHGAPKRDTAHELGKVGAAGQAFLSSQG